MAVQYPRPKLDARRQPDQRLDVGRTIDFEAERAGIMVDDDLD